VSAGPGDGTEIVVIGAGGHGREVHAYLRELTQAGAPVAFAGFVDERQLQTPGPPAVLGDFQALRAWCRARPRRGLGYITAVGDNRVRARFAGQVATLGIDALRPWTLLHPRAHVGPEVELGEGTCVAPGATLTTHVRVGRHSIINVHASISHDAVLDDFVNVNPGAVVCGAVRLGEGCYVGAGATVIQNVSVGAWSIVGAGAVVVRDVPPGVTVVGVPARVVAATPPRP
jgi:hypothetical protein